MRRLFFKFIIVCAVSVFYWKNGKIC